jgi:hypothetical protein
MEQTIAEGHFTGIQATDGKEGAHRLVNTVCSKDSGRRQQGNQQTAHNQ